jgi:hypothetical protein
MRKYQLVNLKGTDGTWQKIKSQPLERNVKEFYLLDLFSPPQDNKIRMYTGSEREGSQESKFILFRFRQFQHNCSFFFETGNSLFLNRILEGNLR